MAVSIGDVLMLSQLSWRTGRAFTSGRKNAPYEFREVELELSRLTKSLKLLAECLFAEDVESIVAQTDYTTRAGIQIVIQFCKQTLDNLESLVEQYQIVRRTQTPGGYTIERSWSELVISNFKTMKWTAGGGNIQELRDTLHMHTSTTAILRQALESKSLDRVEWTVEPISKRIHSMYSCYESDSTEKLDEIERVVRSLMDQSPALAPAFDRVNSVGSEMSNLSLAPPRTSSRSPIHLEHIQTNQTNTTNTWSPSTSPGFRSGSEITPSEPTDAASSIGQPSPVWEKSPMSAWKPPERRANVGKSLPTLPSTPEITPDQIDHRRSAPDSESIRLPPSAWPDNDASTIRSVHNKYTYVPQSEPNPIVLKRSMSTASQQDLFEKALFKNSAIYCDLRGKLVEFVRPSEDEQRPHETSIEEGMEGCRICIVRRRDIRENGQPRFTTSIWSFSDDRSVRLQHKLPDGESIIPFASYFEDEKISITFPTELIFHDISYGSEPLRSVKSSWTNYVFEDSIAATTFQNMLFGHTLLDTFKSEKTTRIHDGLAGALSYQEQMCAMENLRLWDDESTGAVMAMIHYSAQFRGGYLTFYINDTENPIKIKDDGSRTVKIKGLKIPTDENLGMLKRSQSTKEGRRGSEAKKWIMGCRVEFKSEEEKHRFLETVRDLQVRAVTLRRQ